jgi:hypothetical protein
MENSPSAPASAESGSEATPPTLRFRSALDHASCRSDREPTVHVADSYVVVTKQRVGAPTVELWVDAGDRRFAIRSQRGRSTSTRRESERRGQRQDEQCELLQSEPS